MRASLMCPSRGAPDVADAVALSRLLPGLWHRAPGSLTGSFRAQRLARSGHVELSYLPGDLRLRLTPIGEGLAAEGWGFRSRSHRQRLDKLGEKLDVFEARTGIRGRDPDEPTPRQEAEIYAGLWAYHRAQRRKAWPVLWGKPQDDLADAHPVRRLTLRLACSLAMLLGRHGFDEKARGRTASYNSLDFGFFDYARGYGSWSCWTLHYHPGQFRYEVTSDGDSEL